MIRLYTFLIFVAIGAALVYAGFVVSKPDMHSKTTLLAVAENTTTASNMDHVVNSIVYIADIATEDSSLAEESEAVVNVDRIKETNLIDITVYGHSRDDVIEVKNDILKSIVEQVRRYYPKQNLSLYVVEKDSIKQNDFTAVALYVFMIIVAIGLIAGVLLLFNWYDRVREERAYDDRIDGKKIFASYHEKEEKEDIEKEDMHSGFDDTIAEDLIAEEQKEALSYDVAEDKDEVIEERGEVLSDEVEAGVDEAMYDEEQEQVSMPEGLVTTPGNLPVVDASDFGLAPAAGKSSVESNINKGEINNSSQEPTEDELKARLNELLSGKL